MTDIIQDTKPNGKKAGNEKIRILLIEDDQFLRELCEKKLKKENFTVSTAIDGEEGLNKIISEKPTLVLLDIVLPTMDGFEILKRTRKNPDFEVATTPIIILSNLGQEDDLERARKLGASDYLVKAHFTTDEIIKKVEEVLKSKNILI